MKHVVIIVAKGFLLLVFFVNILAAAIRGIAAANGYIDLHDKTYLTNQLIAVVAAGFLALIYQKEDV